MQGIKKWNYSWNHNIGQAVEVSGRKGEIIGHIHNGFSVVMYDVEYTDGTTEAVFGWKIEEVEVQSEIDYTEITNPKFDVGMSVEFQKLPYEIIKCECANGVWRYEIENRTNYYRVREDELELLVTKTKSLNTVISQKARREKGAEKLSNMSKSEFDANLKIELHQMGVFTVDEKE